MPLRGGTYFERAGSGPRLLFCNGSGQTLEGGRFLIDLFGADFDVLAFDYRGLGRSEETEAYEMQALADDVLALLDHVGWEQARVLGISFGGMVAQQLAVTAPERVERLALLCTSSGGDGGSSYPLDELIDRADAASELPTLVDTRFTPEWLAEHPAERGLADLLSRTQTSSGASYRLQMEARRRFDVFGRLPDVSCPTLVAAGRYDGIAPVANGEAIAARIPGAELRIYEGGHAFFVQDAAAVPEIVGFLS